MPTYSSADCGKALLKSLNPNCMCCCAEVRPRYGGEIPRYPPCHPDCTICSKCHVGLPKETPVYIAGEGI